MNLNEEELQELFGDSVRRANAFSKIVRASQEQLYWHIRKMVLSHDDANDILQNTFMKAWKGLDGFRGDSQISTWLYKIATNETLTFLANKKLKYNHSIEDLDNSLIQNLQAGQYVDGNELQLKLQRAIVKLPEKQRLVFNMKYFDDEITYEKMESILGTSIGALKASYHHAVKKIEKFFEDEE